MRILHVVPSYLPATRYGGPIYSVHGLCRALVGLGHEVHVFTTNINGPGNSPVPLAIPVPLEGVRIWYFGVPVLRRLYWSPGLARCLRERITGFDLIHTHSVFLWPTWMAARLARQKSIPYICSPRGMLVKDLVRRRSSWLKHAWISLIEQRNIEHAAGVHATSEAEARELEEFGFALPPVRIIPNGVEIVDIDRAGDHQEENDVQGRMGNPVLLFLGRINWKKGLDRLIAALRYVPGAELVIAGNDEENYQSKLESLADREGVRERIRFVGPVNAESKASLFRTASALVLPSYSENFGNVVLEAMVAGLPVAVTPEVGAADIVRKSGGGIIVNGDPETFGNALKEMLSDPIQLRAMGESGRKAAREGYGWETIARQMEHLYLDVSRQASR